MELGEGGFRPLKIFIFGNPFMANLEIPFVETGIPFLASPGDLHLLQPIYGENPFLVPQDFMCGADSKNGTWAPQIHPLPHHSGRGVAVPGSGGHGSRCTTSTDATWRRGVSFFTPRPKNHDPLQGESFFFFCFRGSWKKGWAEFRGRR